jgi:hypothetical protein
MRGKMNPKRARSDAIRRSAASDDRLAQAAHGQHRLAAEPHESQDVGVAHPGQAAHQLVDVDAGAEPGPGAGEDHRADVGPRALSVPGAERIVLKTAEGVAERPEALERQRVQGLGAVEGEGRDPLRHFEAKGRRRGDGLVLHPSSFDRHAPAVKRGLDARGTADPASARGPVGPAAVYPGDCQR